MNTQIYLIRHGESEYNKFHMHLVGGRSNHSPLTLEGENQAKLLGEYLLEKNIIFDKVYSSSAVRTIGTATIVMNAMNYPLEKIVLSDEILELDQGDFVGKPRIKVYTPEMRRLINTDHWNFKAPNGESQRQVEERMLKFIRENIFNYNYNNVAIFSHGLAIKCAFRGILGSNPKNTYKMQLDNTAITQFSYDGSELNLVKFNDTSHLR